MSIRNFIANILPKNELSQVEKNIAESIKTYETIIKEKDFDKLDIMQMIDDFNACDIESSSGILQKNNRQKLFALLQKIKPQLAQHFNCAEKDILIGDYIPAEQSPTATIIPFEIILGKAIFSDSKIFNTDDLKFVGGDMVLTNSKIKDLQNIEYIGGDLNAKHSLLISLGNLHKVARNLYLSDSKIADIGELQEVGEDAHFEFTKLKSLKNLNAVGGSLNIMYSSIEDLGKVKSVGKQALLNSSKITSLGDLTSIYGDLVIGNCPCKSLGNLKFVLGKLDLTESNIEDLGNLKYVGKDIELMDVQIKAFVSNKYPLLQKEDIHRVVGKILVVSRNNDTTTSPKTKKEISLKQFRAYINYNNMYATRQQTTKVEN